MSWLVEFLDEDVKAAPDIRASFQRERIRAKDVQ
jgi:hypothetical protein